MKDRIGSIVLLQVQPARLVANGRFDPSPLRHVEVLVLEPSGVRGAVDGEWVLDVHHREHPGQDRFNPKRSLSVGFTSHYDHMATRFRPVPLGAAGENVIIEADRQFRSHDLRGGLLVTRNGVDVVRLPGAMVARPCAEFTGFMLDRPGASADEVAEPRRLLDDGVRGFVVSTEDATPPVELRLGDEVWRTAAPSG